MRPNYGIDAPGLVRAFLLAGIGLLIASSVVIGLWASHGWAVWVSVALFIPAIYALFMSALMVWGSLVDKVRDREAILNLLNWSGNERVLDVGCGRGLMLVGAARRLTSGQAVGVDIWAAKDQSSNDKTAPLENAAIEQVADRVAIETADMRELPFPDQSFDVVVSSWAVHNLDSADDRKRTLREMVRVLQPEGTILLTDIVNRQEYAAVFRTIGLAEVRGVVFSKLKDQFLSAISFGSFQPATIVARRALAVKREAAILRQQCEGIDCSRIE